ncbi:glycosyltransferase [Porphyrobacter sp. SLTP]|uniref:glycosyltransferase n=1 Tax=Porphyrobacter sp. SLTP TaxID=2683266 RepID=UPI0014132C92|nr:glycosyltransferase [Porphyrobacter sp. SLTP]
MIFLYYKPDGSIASEEAIAKLENQGINCRALLFPTSKRSPVKWLIYKIITMVSRKVFIVSKIIFQPVFSEKTIGLTKTLKNIEADVFFAHNFETLLPAAIAAENNGAALIFDCMEFYSDMGDGQRADVSRAIVEIEERYLPRCQLVIAASQELASSYTDAYPIRLPLAAYNASPTCLELPQRKGGGLNLYWRNSVLGFGQRGLEDVLAAMARLPSDVHLHLQGHLGQDGGAGLRQRIAELGITAKVSILPPHALGAAVLSAARFDIGLCLERKGPRNHELTVSNKMFDYHMAGLAVIASDLPGLATVIRTSEGGLLYEAGNIQALCVAVETLRTDPELLSTLQQNARKFAVSKGNMEAEVDRVADAVRTALSVDLDQVLAQQVRLS